MTTFWYHLTLYSHNGWILVCFPWNLLYANECVSATSDAKQNVVTRIIGYLLLPFYIANHVFHFKQVSIYQLGLTKVPSFLHHHHFPSFSSDLEPVVHLFEVLPRKEPYKVNLVQLLRLSSSLVAEMKIMTFYTKIFGSPIHKMVGYSQKIEVEASMLPSRETSQTRFTCNTRCGNIAIGCGICYARVRPSMLQVHQPKCLRMLCQHLRKLYRRRVGFRGKLLSGGLGHWKRPVSIMSKLGLELSALFFDSSDNLGDEKRLTGLVLENFK